MESKSLCGTTIPKRISTDKHNSVITLNGKTIDNFNYKCLKKSNCDGFRLEAKPKFTSIFKMVNSCTNNGTKHLKLVEYVVFLIIYLKLR